VTIWAAVFARAGSKGLPGKNLKELGGVPLVGHAVKVAIDIPDVEQVLCSTDSPEIAAAAERYGAHVPFVRPAELADDTSPEWLSWQHLASFLVQSGASDDDLLVSLPATSPLRESSDIVSAIEKHTTSGADVVVSYTAAHRSPWFNMVSYNPDGFLHTVLELSDQVVSRRQDAPEVYDLATVVYVTSLGFVLRAKDLFDGNVAGVEVPLERAIDIDSQLDFDIAEFLYSRLSREAKA